MVCQNSTPPTVREMNSPGAVRPESTLLFSIKTFLIFSSIGAREGGLCREPTVAGHTMAMYVLRFQWFGNGDFFYSYLHFSAGLCLLTLTIQLHISLLCFSHCQCLLIGITLRYNKEKAC